MLDNIAFGIVISVLFVSLLVLFCALIIKLYIQKIKNYTKLIYEKDLDFQKALNSTIIETQEQVLNNISQDLHDDAGQQLTYINLMVENLKFDRPEIAASLDPLSESVQMLSNSIRSISHSLNNQLVMQEDLVKAIEAETGRIKNNSHIAISFKIKGKGKKVFGNNEKIVIYRIFQEALSNIFKHAKASAIHVTLSTDPFFELSISDNGNGFDMNVPKQDVSGLGLQNIIKRAEFINFKVVIYSEPGKGTTITLSEQ